jgi:hypothetical protein
VADPQIDRAVDERIRRLLRGQDLGVLVRQLQGALGGHRLVAGTVASDGSIAAAGTGNWTSSRTAAGVYVVAFQPDFKTAPLVDATPAAATARMATKGTLSASSVTVHMWSDGGAAVDDGFDFFAWGRG